MQDQTAIVRYDSRNVCVELGAEQLTVSHGGGVTYLEGKMLSARAWRLTDDQVRTLSLGLNLIVERMNGI